MMRNVLLCTMQRFMPPSNRVIPQHVLIMSCIKRLWKSPVHLPPIDAQTGNPKGGLVGSLACCTSLGSLFPTSLPAIGSETPAEPVGLRRNEHISELVYAGLACLGRGRGPLELALQKTGSVQRL